MLWLPEALAESFLLASGVKGVRASELDVVGEAPRAAVCEPPAVGAHCAPAVGSFMSLCIGGFERGTYERKTLAVVVAPGG